MEVTDDRPTAIRFPVNLRPRSEGQAGVNHGAGYALIESMPEAQAQQIVAALNAQPAHDKLVAALAEIAAPIYAGNQGGVDHEHIAREASRRQQIAAAALATAKEPA